SNLDAQLRVRMREELRGLIRRLETTTVFVTHDQEEALVLADRIVVMSRGRVEQIGPPAEIYEAPASRFVAEFIGLCNLLEGTVRGGQAGEVLVETRGGVDLRVAGGPATPGERVAVVVRPEHVVPAPTADAPNRLRARIMSTSYLGALSRHRLAVKGEELLMETHAAGPAPASGGDTIDVAVDPRRLRLLR